MRIIQVRYSDEILVSTIDIICEDKNSLSTKNKLIRIKKRENGMTEKALLSPMEKSW